MKKLTFMIGVPVLVFILAAPAMAFEKGTFRLGAGTGLLGTGSGFSTMSLDYDGGGSDDIDTLALALGYFLTDRVEVAVDFSNLDIGSSDFDGFGVAGRYYFPMSENYLYAGGGYQTIDFGYADGSVFYITGGYDYMFRDYFSIELYLSIGQGDIEGDDFDMTDIGVTYSVYFK